jgi:hypothetical protein
MLVPQVAGVDVTRQARRRSFARAVRCGLVACALVPAAVLGGCRGSGYTYVTSASTGTFFKLPEGWKVYNQGDVLTHTGQAGTTSSGPRRLPFFVVFDADPKPSLDHKLSVSTHPFGLARVRSLSADEHDSYSLASLRNEVVNVDQLIQTDPNSVEVVAPPKLLVRRGMRGTHLEYTVHNPDGTAFSVDQLGFVDAATRTVWILLVGCNAPCYAQNKAAINRVADSWTVEGK